MKESPIKRLIQYRESHPDVELKRLNAVKNSKKIKLALLNSYKNNKEKAISNRMAHLKLQAGTNHVSSKYYDLRDPRGIRHKGKGISSFIRNNPNLFNPEDIVWTVCHSRKGKLYLCRALRGISGLKRKDRPVGHWRGWTLVSEEEKFYNNGDDLIGRSD